MTGNRNTKKERVQLYTLLFINTVRTSALLKAFYQSETVLITSRKQLLPSTDGQPLPFPIYRGVLQPNSFQAPRFTKLLRLRLLNIANWPCAFKTRFNAPAANYYSKHIWRKSFIERFSFECRKVIGFALSTRCDWLKRFAPPFHPIRSKTKANCDALACIFPRFASATCNYFEFWLVQCIVCVLCDWPE